MNGAIYSAVNPSNVAVFDIHDIGSFDINFDMVGTSIDTTCIRVRRVTKDCKFMTAASKIAGKLAGIKGNVRNLWNGVGKMISVGERKDGKEYITNKQFDELDPSISVEQFGKMASDTIKTKFFQTYKTMKYLERDADFQSFIGSSVHSLDASVNLGNASHYDNCDIG